MYGISKKESTLFFSILSKYKKSIAAVRLFGSRARGDHRENSDFDLAVSYLNPVHNDVISEFENSWFPYTVDVVNYEKSTNQKLKENIIRDGKLIFLTKEGKFMVTLEQLKSKLEDYSRATERLGAALEKDLAKDDMYVDGTIQRFEFSFELAWKLIKSALEYDGIEANSPRASICEGFKAGIIKDAAKWLDMLEKRNLSPHTCDEETALGICECVKKTYYPLLAELKETTEKRIFENQTDSGQ